MSNDDAAAAAPAPPKLIFLVPYRNREQQKIFFQEQMARVLSDYAAGEVEIYFCHQCDTREFNRGAVKNIGFLAMKAKYPEAYQNITFIFNDIDTMPYTKNFLPYETTAGTIKHFYGFTYTLGGIVSITGGDFEKINGFNMLWSWGFEDSALQQRAMAAGLRIDRTVFYPINDVNILHFRDGIIRTVNRTDFNLYMSNFAEGLTSLTQLEYEEEGEFLQIRAFDTGRVEDVAAKSEYDLRNGNAPFGQDPFGRNKTANLGLGLMKCRAKPRMGSGGPKMHFKEDAVVERGSGGGGKKKEEGVTYVTRQLPPRVARKSN